MKPLFRNAGSSAFLWRAALAWSAALCGMAAALAADDSDTLTLREAVQATLEANPGGTGLGLAIVRDIATLHGATLALDRADAPSHDYCNCHRRILHIHAGYRPDGPAVPVERNRP